MSLDPVTDTPEAIARYATDIGIGSPFEWRVLGGDPHVAAEHAALWPLRKMPVRS